MSDTGNQVRRLQTHLRDAGALIAARRYDEAAAHVEAALALDPASLAALTLRDRIQKARAGALPLTPPVAPAPDRLGAMPLRDAPEPPRFIPPGVNAASWLDFEQRVQERRFRALLETAQRAIAARDGVAARSAIEEARELRPDSIDVEQLSGRAALLPILPPPSHDRYARSRTVRAVSMLLVGVAFLMGLDWLRSGPTPDALDGVVAADGMAPVTDMAASVRPAPPPLPRLSTVPDVPAPADGMEVARGTAGRSADGETAPVVLAPRREEPPVPETAPPATLIDTRVAAAPPAAPPAITPRGEVPDDYVAPAAREARAAAAPSLSPAPPAGEVPDTYVAPQVQREAVAREGGAERPLPAGQAAGTPAAAANVVRNPAAVVESLSSARAGTGARPEAPQPRAPAAARAEAVVTPVRPDDETLVQSALQQYARAYGRLDARAAKAVWPSVDETKLARAFADLESQTFAFDDCDISVSGPTASASCRGRATFAGKVGGTRTESRTWRFDLRRDGEEWKIATAETRR